MRSPVPTRVPLRVVLTVAFVAVLVVTGGWLLTGLMPNNDQATVGVFSMGAALIGGVVVAAATLPGGELELVAAREPRVRYLRATAGLLLLLAVTAVPAAAGATGGASSLLLLRDLIGSVGLGLVAVSQLGTQVAAFVPMAYTGAVTILLRERLPEGHALLWPLFGGGDGRGFLIAVALLVVGALVLSRAPAERVIVGHAR